MERDKRVLMKREAKDEERGKGHSEREKRRTMTNIYEFKKNSSARELAKVKTKLIIAK
jgi:hypothetical protein